MLFHMMAVFARCFLVVVIPVAAYERLGSAGEVSVIYLIASCLAFCTSLFMPRLLARYGQDLAVHFGLLSAVLMAVFLFLPWKWTLVPAVVAHVLMSALFEGAAGFAAMRAVPRTLRGHYESQRVMYGGVGFVVAPFLASVMMHNNMGSLAVLTASGCGLVAWLIMRISVGSLGNRQSTRPIPGADRTRSSNSSNVLKRFIASHGMRTAWLLAVGRAVWWNMLYTYSPLLAIASAVDLVWSGALISATSCLLLVVPLWAVVLRRNGPRRFMFAAYGACGLLTIFAGIAGHVSFFIAAAFLMIASIAMSAIDSVGNGLFLRALRQRQATEMVPIFYTFRDVAQISSAAVYALLLIVFEVTDVFTFTGIITLGFSLLCLGLPRRAL
ncbi:MFS transporter [Daeguia caeni]